MSLTPTEILRRLESEYGPRYWEPHLDPLSELISCVLSQNTSDKNSRPAFQELKARFPRWEDMAQASPDEIASAIRRGGLANVKAPRLKHLLQEIHKRRGALNLSFLSELPIAEAKAWMTSLPGVGPKTAAVVLLFSFDKPALPVDTHVYRVSQRLGLFNSKLSPEKAQAVLEGMVSPQDYYAFHVLLIEHGRQVCRARQPLHTRCVLADDCPYYQQGGNP
ncbi:MAG: endonuclease III [Chloroflexota bacterium]